MFKNFNFNDEEKKKLITLLSLGLICVICLLGINIFQNKNKSAILETPVANENEQETEVTAKKDELELKLTEILKEINGVGDVSVMITYDNSQEIEPAYNSSSTKETTSETDSTGGERTVETSSENKTIVTSDSSKPIVIKTNEAKVKGVLVIASGANDSIVKETLYEAVKTALQISGHQVQVYAK